MSSLPRYSGQRTIHPGFPKSRRGESAGQYIRRRGSVGGMWRRKIRGVFPDMTISRVPRAWVPERKSERCGGKTSLEGSNSSCVRHVTSFVFLLIMASQTGCEIMNSEVAGSILAVFPAVKRNTEFSHVQEPVKLNHLKTTMGAIRSLQVTPIPKSRIAY